jgi:hypothetical protein
MRYALLAPLAGVMLIAACSRATLENYSKVQSGMTREQVYEILGEPDEVNGGGLGQFTISSEVWKGNQQTINITFGSEKVALKSITQNATE